MPGLFSGNIAKSTPGPNGVALPENTGEKMISTTALIRPPYMLITAPRVVNRRQKSEYRIVGRLALAATAKASATRNATFCPCADPAEDRHDADRDHRAARDLHLVERARLGLAVLDHVRVDVVGEGRRRGDRQPGDHREDGRERDGGDDAQQDRPAEPQREQRRRRVDPARRGEDRLAPTSDAAP